ncbi:hypothetical protein C0J52_27551 [Blattella germanica]|nr:hypothetical protein C0J52_27551 [Blattella germanica]
MKDKKACKQPPGSRFCAHFIIIVLAVTLLLKCGPGSRGSSNILYNSDLFSVVEGSIFEGFNNETGSENGSYIVPNYIHFLFFKNPEISYVHAVCVLAAFKNQNPEKVFFHTDVKEFRGDHWNKIRDTLGDALTIVNASLPDEIFGQKFSDRFHVWHAGDVTRIRILMKYGGIFLDNDSFLIRSLDHFRKFEMTVGVTDLGHMGTQVLIAHKDARFLKLWLESYRNYVPDKWYYNAGEKPMLEIIEYKPEIVHKVQTRLGLHTNLTRNLYIWDRWNEWRDYYSVHLVIRHRYYLDTIWNFFKWRYIDETNICDYPKPFGEMAREIYSDFCYQTATTSITTTEAASSSASSS